MFIVNENVYRLLISDLIFALLFLPDLPLALYSLGFSLYFSI